MNRLIYATGMLVGLLCGFLLPAQQPSPFQPPKQPVDPLTLIQKGDDFAVSKAAVINALGKIDGATGDDTDCVRVDGSASPCVDGLVIGDIPDLSSLYQPLDSDLTALAALTTAVYGRSLLETANAGAAQALLALVIGTNVQAYDADLTTYAGITPSANVQSLLGAANYAAMRQQLDLEAGTDFYSISAADTLLAAKVAGAASLTTASVIPRVTASGELGPSKLSCTGSPVTCTLYDDNGGGSTTLTIRQTAGQAGTPFEIKNSSNATKIYSDASDFSFFAEGGYKDNNSPSTFSLANASGGLALGSGMGVLFSADTTFFGSKDVGFFRSAANIACVNRGGSDCTNKGDLILRNCIEGCYAISGSSSIDFGSINDGACAVSTFALSGAVTGDYLYLLTPAIDDDTYVTARVSASDTVQIKLCNLTGAAYDPGALTFGVRVGR